jgi:hypothetical protein
LGTVFISYRREDSAPSAGRIYDRLAQRMGPDNVFFDVENIQPGSDFAHVLAESVGDCDALVAVIGRRWISSTDENNQRRLDDPNDFVRIEIEAALQRDVRVIPVLVDGAAMPKSKDLPEALKRLSRKQGIEISHTRFDSDVERLTRALSLIEKQLLKAAIPASLENTRAATPTNVGILTPKVELLFSPKDPGSGLIPKLQIGRSNVFFVGPSGPFGKLLFPALTESQFKVESIGGKVKVSTRIANDTGSLLVEIVRNEWLVAPPPQTWDRNYSDDALEVRDSSGWITLQVRALLDRIQIQGMWWVDLGPPNGVRRMTIWEGTDPEKGAQLVFTPKNGRDLPPEITPVFVYPSELHLGELRAK